jgi:hypothetical protein
MKEVAQFLGYFFCGKKVRKNTDRKLGWATFWAIFFTNSSGHPAHQAQKLKNENCIRRLFYLIDPILRGWIKRQINFYK